MAARIGSLVAVVLCAAAVLSPASGRAQAIPAFPGADGAAAFVSGGRGGIVYHVTKLNSAIDDPQRNDPGTLRYGLNNANFPSGVPRTIVFDVGGVFYLGRLPQPANNWDPNGNGWDAQSRLTIGGTNITLAGQTAPGAGVIFMGGGLKPQGNNNIIRNITVAAGYGLQGWWSPGNPMRAAPGTPEAGTDASQWFPDNTVYDAMDIAGTNLMIDHVSTLYATDETISMNEVANNITVQYSNISQGQNYPQWDAEGGGLTGHALGSLLSAASNAAISFHNNLYAHQKGRVPQLGVGSGQASGAYYDFRNNVFYNWFGTAGTKSGTTNLNLVNNFYLAGNGGDNPAGGTNPAINTSNGGTGIIGASSSVYRNGNFLDSNRNGSANDGVLIANGGPANPLWAGGVATYNGATVSAAQTFDRVLNYVGANWWTRDDVIDTPDERIIHEVRTGTGKIRAWADDPWNNDPAEGAEWRALKNTPATNRAADWDIEPSVGYGVGDGMPTWWELAHGLNPNARDDAGDFDNDGYTNLEEYLNEIAAWPAPGPIVFNGATNARYAQITNWDGNPDPARTHNWQPSRYDVAEIRNGVAAVDAVGQHAGVIRVAPGGGETAALNVTAGWISVQGTLDVGAGGAGAVSHSGGVVTASSVALGGAAGGVGVYHLTGTGTLAAGVLEKASSASQFTFTGGTLSVDDVRFDLVNDGGLIAAASGPTIMEIQGDLTMNAGAMRFVLAGPNPLAYDEVHVLGHFNAGGVLQVQFIDGYVPAVGDTFDLLDFASTSGALTLQAPALDAGLAWDASRLLTTGELAVVAAPSADFDGDGRVDGRDLLVWQLGLGLTGQTDRTNGDADRNGVVDALDLAVWQQQYGTAQQSASAGVAVPEPATICLAALGAAVAASAGRVRSRRATIAAAALVALAAAAPASGQIKAFPQAEGFGAGALGGRGGDVYRVTNLSDSGPGSLRYGVENAPSSGRTIVFDVGGWIQLTSKLGLTRNRITIAGHTAPGGIGIRGAQFSVGGDDIIVRHMRFRPGKAAGSDHDSINTNENAQRVIYDHISAEFSTDGGFDLQADLVTLQYSSVSFGLYSHSTGGLIQSPSGGAAGKLSFHHNMFAHNQTRNPKARSELIDWRDNVVYNYHNGFLAGESETDVNPNWRANFDGNTYISNIGSQLGGSGGRPMMTGGRAQNYDLWYGVNALDRDSDANDNPVVYARAQAQSNQSVVSSAYNWYDNPFDVGAAEVWQSGSPAAAYHRVLAEFGATPWARDAVNQLISSQVLSRTGQRIERESDLGLPNAGYPNLNPNNLQAPLDSDGDGIPDAWETKHGLNPLVASNNGDFDSDGFTNLEEYLNDLAAFKAIGPLEFDGTGRYADWANWTRRWEPSRLDDVYIPLGTATVDAVGQKAGLLRVGSQAGSTGTLAVTNGWIEVASHLQVGVGGSGVVNQSGGEVRVLTGGVVLANGNYHLAGGTLVAPQVTQSSAGVLLLTGGRLSVGAIHGDVANNGSTIAPGASPDMTSVHGNLTLNSGALEIELAGAAMGQFDRVVVAGALTAGGTLDVRLIGGFTPAAGAAFDILDFASASGGFTLALPPLAGGLAWDASNLLATGVLAVVAPPAYEADFNGDGRVDAADRLVWAAGYGLTGQTNNHGGDANGDGVVDSSDFLVWQRQNGAAGGAVRSATALSNVPEPAGAALALIVAAALARGPRRKSS